MNRSWHSSVTAIGVVLVLTGCTLLLPGPTPVKKLIDLELNTTEEKDRALSCSNRSNYKLIVKIVPSYLRERRVVVSHPGQLITFHPQLEWARSVNEFIYQSVDDLFTRTRTIGSIHSSSVGSLPDRVLVIKVEEFGLVEMVNGEGYRLQAQLKIHESTLDPSTEEQIEVWSLKASSNPIKTEPSELAREGSTIIKELLHKLFKEIELKHCEETAEY